MLKSTERLIALAILHQTYSSSLANPFISFFINVKQQLTLPFTFYYFDNLSMIIMMLHTYIHTYIQAACDDEAEKYERAFVLQLLASSSYSGSAATKEVSRENKTTCLFHG